MTHNSSSLLRELVDKTSDLIDHLKATGRLRSCFNVPALDEARAFVASQGSTHDQLTGSLAEQIVLMVLDDIKTCYGELGADWVPTELSTETVDALVSYAAAHEFKQPGWHHVMGAFIAGAREARLNPTATDDDFKRAADGYTKRVHEEVDPESERRLRENDWGDSVFNGEAVGLEAPRPDQDMHCLRGAVREGAAASLSAQYAPGNDCPEVADRALVASQAQPAAEPRQDSVHAVESSSPPAAA